MNTVFVKKNTEGGAGGLSWEAGEVKELYSYVADELIKLAPGDYELVSQDEFTPETLDEGIEIPDEEPERPEEPTTEPVSDEAPDKPKRPYNKKKSETPSAE
jgi:hypothetical protein